MHAHFERQMNQVDSSPTVSNKVSIELPSIATDPDTSSHPETITEDSKLKLALPAAVVTTMTTVATIESPLIVLFDIRYDSYKEENKF
jgi:hypothetical protein